MDSLPVPGNASFWTFATTAVTAIVVIIQMVLQRRDASRAAGKAEEVKADLKKVGIAHDGKLNSIQNTADKVEKLVNNQTSEALKRIADLEEREAARTQDPEQVRKALLARQKSDEHEATQARLDETQKRRQA